MNRSVSAWVFALACIGALTLGTTALAGTTGGCCLENSTCLDGVTQSECETLDGAYAGDDTGCATLVCHARPYTFTLSPGNTNVAVPQFDDEEGTRNLAKVTLHLESDLNAAVTLTNISAGQIIFDTTVTYDANVTAMFGTVGPLVVMVDETFDCGPGVILGPGEQCDFGGPLDFLAKGTDMVPPPSELGGFVGAGTINAAIAGTGIFAFQGGVPFTLAVPIHFVDGTVTAIYEYIEKPGACCFSDGTCVELSFDECTAQSGEWQGPNTSCSTELCPGACCLQTGECIDNQSLAQCTAQNGEYQGLNSTCAATLCPGACCLQNGTCIDGVSIAQCSQQGGTYQGLNTSCDTVVCPGACCLQDGTCLDQQTLDECNAVNGEYQGYLVLCADVTCPGACCLQNGACLDNVSLAACEAQGGEYQGLGTTCAQVACPGACCLQSGECLDNQSLAQCDTQGGEYQGLNSTCAAVVCPGACCLQDGTCVDGISIAACIQQNGEYQGLNTTCASVTCPGACCLPNGTCLDAQTLAQCNQQQGVYQGLNSTCAQVECGGACCLPDGTCQDSTTLAECNALQGDWQGAFSTCATVRCEGACCLPNGDCLDAQTLSECTAMSGTYQGLGSTCAIVGDSCCVGVIGDFIWEDTNRDGVQSGGEPGIPGVTVTLFLKLPGGGLDLVGSVMTNRNGLYQFTGLCAGDYQLEVDETDLPTGYFGTTPNVPGDDEIDSDCDGGMVMLTLPTNGTVDESIDCGYQPANGMLGDFIWEDTNRNGLQDPGEPGIPDVTVCLYKVMPGGIEIFLECTQTTARGFYGFDDLLGGDYRVEVDETTLPEGYFPAASNVGTDDAIDSDCVNGSAPATLADSTDSDLTIDCGYEPPNGKIGDFIWEDTNRNGLQDPGEPGLPGIEVCLVSMPGSVPVGCTTTGPNGEYLFDGLVGGDYVVIVTESDLPEGYFPTPSDAGDDALDSDCIDGAAAVTLPDSQTTDLTIDCGYQPPNGMIGDFIWEDTNRNGLQDPGEPGLPGIEVCLVSMPGSVPVGCTTTGPNGEYLFDGLVGGDYVVIVTESDLPEGYFPTPSDAGDDALDSDCIDGAAAVTLPDSQTTDLTIDCGYQPPNGMIGDFIWEDTNRNGLQDPGEPGLPGIEVCLVSMPGSVPVGCTTTGPNGEYLFDGLVGGDYVVIVTESDLPEGYFPTPSDAGDDALDSDCIDGAAAVTLPDSQTTDLTIDCGYQPPNGMIGDFIWEDTNRNGLQDPGEPGLPGIEVCLVSMPGSVPVGCTTTGPDGEYLFDGLVGGDYVVIVTESDLPEGYFPTPSDAGDDALDSDCIDGAAAVTLPDSQTTDLTIDCGYQPPNGMIGDFIWDDQNGDGIQDPGEPGLPNVTVCLYSQPGNVLIECVTTGPDGEYLFDDLLGGDYTVEVDETTLPAGYFPVPSGQGGDPALDSNCENGVASVTLPDSQTTDLTIDCGYQPPAGVIGDFIWDDTNRDGIQDPGEPGIPGVTVCLYAMPANTLISCTTTGPDGEYMFGGLLAGDYRVEVDETTLPEGYFPSPSNQGGNDALDSDCVDGSALVTLPTSADSDLTIDCGYQPPNGTIGDFIWSDTDRDGIQDAGEPGIPGVTVCLYSEPGHVLVECTTTGPNGEYLFDGLLGGDYTVEVDETTLPAGSFAAPANQGGNDALDSDCVDGVAPVTLADSQSSDLTIDCGYEPPCAGSIGDFIFNDLNSNGIQDAGEGGLGGVTVTLYLKLPGGDLELIGSQTTGPDGAYLFEGLCAADYQLEIDPTTVPEGVTETFPNEGPNDNIDSDCDGGMVMITLPTSDSNDDTVDCGFRPVPGACCLQDGTCVEVTEVECTDQNGEFQGFGTLCADVTCPGACCLPDGSCIETSLDDCTSQSGTYQGLNTTCDTVTCPGACCLQDGTCVVTTLGDCTAQDGEFQGLDSTCDSVDCPGACCLQDGSCVDNQTLDACMTQGGVYQGLNTSCSTVTCPGACCLQDGSCLDDLTVAECEAMDGTYQGLGSQCSQIECPCDGVIGDFIFVDENADGIQDEGEPGLGGIGLTLYLKLADGGLEFIDSTTSSATGFYQFTGLCAGVYQLEIDPTTVPENVEETLPNQGPDPERDSDCNGGMVMVTLSTATTVDISIDCGFRPIDECEVECSVEIIEIPPPDDDDDDDDTDSEFECDQKIVGMTMIWDGTQAVRIKAYDGAVGSTLLADIDDINIGDAVTILGLDGPNDVFWQLYAAGTDSPIGQSKFHRSCSDDDMDGPEDCGKRQGNGKSNDGGFVNDWLLAGLVDGSGGAFDCDSPSDPFSLTDGGDDDDDDEPAGGETLLRVGFTADDTCNDVVAIVDIGCDQIIVDDGQLIRLTCGPGTPPDDDDDSSSDFECDQKITAMTMIWDGTEPVRIRAYDGETDDTLLADIDDIQVGDTVTVSGMEGPNNVYWEVFAAGTDDLIGLSEFHRSCSDDDMDGPEDCGKRQGNGKSDDEDLLNDWILEGLLDGSGSFFNCSTMGGFALTGDDEGDDDDDDDDQREPPSDCSWFFDGDVLVINSESAVLIVTATNAAGDESVCEIDLCEFLGGIIGEQLELSSFDAGADPDAFNETLTGSNIVERLHVSRIGQVVSLVDQFDDDGLGQEWCEAIYVEDLWVAPGATLLTNGCPVYYMDGVIEGTVDMPENLIKVRVDSPCTADIDGSGTVDFTDLMGMMSAWGTCPPEVPCVHDLDQNGEVGFADLITLLDAWGPCVQ